MSTRQVLPWFAAAWCLGYGALHVVGALVGPPPAVRAESLFAQVWLPAIPAAGLTVTSALVGMGVPVTAARGVRWVLVFVSWLSGALLSAYCLLLWPSLAQLLIVPFGYPLTTTEVAALLLRLAGTVAAALGVLTTADEWRLLRGACRCCGRVHGRSPESRRDATRWWGYLGGYLAVGGLVARLLPALPGWVAGQGIDGPGGVGFALFVVLMILAGTVLPLALVHRWGRLWPWWFGPWAGRRVPRWVVLGPAVMMSVGLIAYFGVGGVAAMLLGKTTRDLVAATEIIGYAVWGVGLSIACCSYAALTRRPCPAAGPGSAADRG